MKLTLKNFRNYLVYREHFLREKTGLNGYFATKLYSKKNLIVEKKLSRPQFFDYNRSPKELIASSFRKIHEIFYKKLRASNIQEQD